MEGVSSVTSPPTPSAALPTSAVEAANTGVTEPPETTRAQSPMTRTPDSSTAADPEQTQGQPPTATIMTPGTATAPEPDTDQGQPSTATAGDVSDVPTAAASGAAPGPVLATAGTGNDLLAEESGPVQEQPPPRTRTPLPTVRYAHRSVPLAGARKRQRVETDDSPEGSAPYAYEPFSSFPCQN